MSEDQSPWHAIHAGGRPRQAFDRGQWITPYFASLDNCREWWSLYCMQTREPSTWAITSTNHAKREA